MKILLLNGSASRQSHTEALLLQLKKNIELRGIEAELINLLEEKIPTVMPEFHDNPSRTPNAAVRSLIRKIAEADAVIIGSPVYHGSFSGLLKNALDSLVGDVFRGKVVGLTSNAGGMPNTHVLEQLRSVIRTMYGLTIQTQIATSSSDFKKIRNGFSIADTAIIERADRMIEELLFLTSALGKANTAPVQSV